MALKKTVKAFLVGAVAIGGALATQFADNKSEMTRAANEKDQAMEVVWNDLLQQQNEGKLSKEEVVSAMEPHVKELADLEGKERGALAGMILSGAALAGAGGLLVLGDKKKPNAKTLG